MRVCLECHILIESGSRWSSCQLERDRIRFAQPLQREIRSRAWRKERDLHLRQHRLCVDCLANGVVVAADQLSR